MDMHQFLVSHMTNPTSGRIDDIDISGSIICVTNLLSAVFAASICPYLHVHQPPYLLIPPCLSCLVPLYHNASGAKKSQVLLSMLRLRRSLPTAAISISVPLQWKYVSMK